MDGWNNFFQSPTSAGQMSPSTFSTEKVHQYAVSALSNRIKWGFGGGAFLGLQASSYTIKLRSGRWCIEEKTWESRMKYICILGSLMIVGVANVVITDGAGECGKASPDILAWKLAPCATAAQDEHADVSSSCCSQVKMIGQNPSCLCAVMLSNTAKMSGADPAVAVTIPKRCNLANRPVGMKCGAYTLP